MVRTTLESDTWPYTMSWYNSRLLVQLTGCPFDFSMAQVVLDSMNYIKGFRYELHCSARQENTQHCVVWVQTTRETAAEWNASRPETEAYPSDL